MLHILPVNKKFVVMIGYHKYQICDIVLGAFEPVVKKIYTCQKTAIKMAKRLK